MTSDSYLRDRDAAEEQHAAQKRNEERAAFVKNIETHLEDISKDVTRVARAFEDWNNQLERKQIDGDALKSRLCDVSNLLDDIYNELRGL